MQFFNIFTVLYLLLIAPLFAFPIKGPNESEREMGPLERHDAPEKATASVILLHGIGNSSDVFHPFPPRFYAQERFRHINFIFPNAPIRYTPYWHEWRGGDPYTRSWFNTTMEGHVADENEYWEVADYIQDLILNETAHGIRPERIIAGGYSQGGVESLGAIASGHVKIGGWLLFSSFLPQELTRFYQKLNWVNKKTPIFHGHGQNDTAVPVTEAIRTANLYKKLGFNYHLHVYPNMGHQTDWEPNDLDVEEFIAKTIPKKWSKKW